MNTIAYDRREPDLDEPNSGAADEQPLPRRRRRQFFNRRSAALVAVLTCAAGFYAGVRVEKGQLASTPRTLSFGATGVGSASTRGGAAASRGSASGTAASSSSGSGSAGGATTGAASRFGAGGAGAGGAGASFGTVSTVNGKTLVVNEASGNTVKVKLSSSTKITKSQSVSRKAIRPGDTVVISGVPNSTGTVVAATVSDSGTGSGLAGAFGGFGGARGGAAGSGTGTSGSGTSGSGSGSGSSGRSGSGSAVGSLFSSGGGG